MPKPKRAWDQVCTRCNQRKEADDFCPSGHQNGSYCRDCSAAWKRENLTPAVRRKNNLWSAYRLRPDDYDDLLAAQGGGCAICGATEKLTVDHDHKCCSMKPTCGKCIRGILCEGCNKGIGHLAEDPGRLHRAAGYVTRRLVLV